MVEGLRSCMKYGKMHKATYVEVASWVLLEWEDINPKIYVGLQGS